MEELIHNRYELIEAIGVGGMGAVFLARDQHLNRKVALKVARVDPPTPQRLAEATLFLKREARALAQLNHPSIPIIYDYCADTHDPAYLALELIQGANLAQLLKPKTAASGPHNARALAEDCLGSGPCPRCITHPRRHQARQHHGGENWTRRPHGLWLYPSNSVQGPW